MSFLWAEGLGKAYASSWALRNASLSVECGEAIAIVGPNGSGKTTLLNCLSGVLRPTEGRVSIGGVTWDKSRRNIFYHTKVRVGIVTTKPLLYSELTLKENFTFFARLAKRERPVTTSLVEHFELGNHLQKRPVECSDGILRRASMVRALVADPELLFLDEPLSHLDPKNQARTIDFLAGLNAEGVTILLTSHEPELLAKLSPRVFSVKNSALSEECIPSRAMRWG